MKQKIKLQPRSWEAFLDRSKKMAAAFYKETGDQYWSGVLTGLEMCESHRKLCEAGEED